MRDPLGNTLTNKLPTALILTFSLREHVIYNKQVFICIPGFVVDSKLPHMLKSTKKSSCMIY